MKQTMTKRRYVLIYTLVFAVAAAGAFFLFPKNGKSMVWNQDGGPQYLPYLAYIGQYLRETLRSFLRGDFTLKMFDFKIGLGADVGTVFKPHPLELLSVFVPAAGTEVLYQALILLRLYLAGLTFSLFCFLFTQPSLHVVTGSVIYVFCGYVFILGIRHPTFDSPLVLLPLLLYAAERLMRRKGFALFSLTVCLTFMSNYYFMYMCSIVLAIYVLLRLPALRREAGGFFRLLGRLLGAYLLGVGMNMATLLPIIFDLRSSARLASGTVLKSLFFNDSLSSYYLWLVGLITPRRSAVNGVNLNYSVMVLPALAALFGARKKGRGAQRAAVLIALAFLLIPVLSYLMTAFSALGGRWIFAFSLVMALIFALNARDLTRLSAAQWVLLILFCGAYFFLAGDLYRRGHKLSVLTGILLLAGALAVILLVNLFRPLRRIAPVLFLGVTLVSVSANAYFVYSGRFGDVISEYLPYGEAFRSIYDSEFSRLTKLPQEEFWRADSNRINSNRENYPLLLGYNGTSVYNSVISGPMTYALYDQENTGLGSIHRIQGLGSRTVLAALSNVRYYLTGAGDEQHAPYGFVRREEYSDDTYSVLENQFPLAFGYSYDTFVSKEDYEKLSAMEREQVMLSGVVVDQVPEGAKTVSAPPAGMETVQVRLPDQGKDAVRTEEGYTALANNAAVSIPYERRAGYETYVRLFGFYTQWTSNYVYLYDSDLRTTLMMRGPGTAYSHNQTGYIVRLGYEQEGGADTVTLEFDRKGDYHLEGIELIYVPMDSYEERIAALGEDSLLDPVISDNTVSGRVSLSERKMMVFSIPYSRGWTAEVDGAQTPLVQANVSYLGLLLAPGEHRITLRYISPGAAAGRWITLISWVAFLVLAIFSGIRRRQYEPGPDRGPDEAARRYSRYHALG